VTAAATQKVAALEAAPRRRARAGPVSWTLAKSRPRRSGSDTSDRGEGRYVGESEELDAARPSVSFV
jgi:hypothetical protein